jgi:O-antigen ligase
VRIEGSRGWLAAFFIILSLVLGGASARGAGAIGNAVLQMTAVLVIVASLWRRRSAFLPAARQLALIVGAFLLFVLLSMIPLPPSVWQSLPERESIAQGYELLGIELPPLPFTLSWQHSLASILWLLPPAGAFLLVVQSTPSERTRLVWILLAFAGASIVLGVAQLFGGENSPLRFYQITNPNQPVGFFSNANHFAMLLVCSLPLTGYLAGRAASGKRSTAERSGSFIIAGAAAVFLIAGIATVGSLAGYGLALPAAFAAFLIYRKAAYGEVGLFWGASSGALFVLFLGFAFAGPLNTERLSEQFSGAPSSRAYLASTTMEGIRAYFPAGSGLGTFQEVYRPFDDPNRASQEYTNHAHNDYLEIVLELGLFGLLLVVAFVIWWLVQSLAAWRSSLDGSGLARAGSVIVFVILLHSIVDYPLRTSAMAVMFALACALLVPYRPSARARAAAPEEDGESLVHLKVE